MNACGHCGLPLGPRPVAAVVDGVRIRCCCYGCVLAWQVTRARGEEGAAAAIFVRLGLGVFFAVNVMMVSMPAYVPYVYGAEAGATDGPLFHVLRVLAIALTAPVLALLGGPILASAWRGLRDGGANTDAVIVVGTLAAYGLSIANTLAGRPAVYFDTAAMLLVLVTVGRYLEAHARAEAGAAVRARLAPVPDAARRVRADGDEEAVAPETLAPGDLVRVRPGSVFPTDGLVESGEGGVDEATLTGESWPIAKRPGDRIAGGTCSVDGTFLVRVSRTARESTAARIGDLLTAAFRERAPWQRTADRAGAVLGPVVIVLAAVTAAVWTARADLEHGLLTGLAVLVVACPCALGIATPLAIWTGLASASRHGVIVRNAPALERAAALATVIFDKTGTLTTRLPRLERIDVQAGGDRAAILARAAALARLQSHPLAQAIVAAASTERTAAPPVTDVQSLPGLGATGRVDGVPVVIGSRRLATEILGRDVGLGADHPHDAAGPRVYVLEDGRLAAVLHFVEAPRRSAATALAALRRLGVQVLLATGDARASAVVPSLVAPADTRVQLLPEDKVTWLGQIRTRSGLVAMVGDGVNDAPALAGADLGIAIGSATDLARLTADVAIVSDDLTRIPWLIAHARRVGRVARQNLAWAIAYNAAAVALAATGRLGPLVAAAAMVGSSLAVVANARRLTGTDPIQRTAHSQS